MRLPSCCPALLLTALASAQVAPGNAVVMVRQPGTPATQLLAVNLTSGATSPLPRFPADVLTPLAVAIDPIDGEMVLAMDAGSGISRLFRYTMAGGVPAGERAMGDVPGHVTELGFTGNQLIASVDGLQGGVWRMPRNGGTPALAFPLPHLSAMLSWGAGQHGAVAWSGSQGPPTSDAGVGIVDLLTGLFALGPDNFPNFAHPGITGVMDLPTALPRQLLSHTDGTVSLYTMFLSSPPLTIAVTPPVPPGGCAAMKPMSPYGISPLVLGGSAFPFLWTFDAMAASPSRTLVAGPLPGDPVDFAVTQGSGAQVVFFGTACGSPPISISFQNLPQLGTPNFQIDLLAARANSPALLVLGFTDQLGGVLPYSLPGGCPLLVSPDAVSFHLTSATGTASRVLPVPVLPGLNGLRLYAQWLQITAGSFIGSGAMSIRVGT